MKKTLSMLLACLMVAGLLAGCTGALATEEIVDGRFTETRKITVEVYDRSNDNGTTPENNVYTDFIKEGMLRDHNVEVTFVPVARWTETEQINNLLAAGDAPDVCVTYSYPTIQTYAKMGGVLDMEPYLEQYKDMLPNLWELLTDDNIYWNQDPDTGEIWGIEARLFHNPRINTFVREDWLTKLGIAAPTTIDEFEAMLVAFQENAELLLGDDADKMVPFGMSYDVGWRADLLNVSFVPDDLTDYDAYINGFDDRHLLYPGYKEGIRKLNDWYNKGLIWQDFALYPAGDTTEDNMIKAGFVGAFMHNWDYPYRNGDNGLHASLQQLVGEDAVLVAIDAFQNEAGVYRKFLANPIDRKLFFPNTNTEPLASLLYLDWISTFENRFFLQFGEEGVTHEVQADGSLKTIFAAAPDIMNSPNNIDYTITINGIDAGEYEKTINSVASGYAGVDARLIQIAYDTARNDYRIIPHVNVGPIASEEGVGETLKQKRDAFLDQAVVASPDKFDEVYDSGLADYLASGGQAIIDERIAGWAKYFGDATTPTP